jgi:microcystin-dependent protein
MAVPYIGEVKMVSFGFAPRDWAFCDGQLLPINQNQTLYSLLGTTFGGDGHTTFALPDLRGRTPIHFGDYNRLGMFGGEEEVELSFSEMPEHTHTVVASNEPADKRGGQLATLQFAVPETNIYGNAASLVSFHEKAVTEAGSSTTITHTNLQPSTVTNFIIALDGVFPSRN